MADTGAGQAGKTERDACLGATLLRLVQTVSADGSLSDAETAALERWLGLPRGDSRAFDLLDSLVGGIVLEGAISRDLRRALYGSLEGIVSQGLRGIVTALRRELEPGAVPFQRVDTVSDESVGQVEFVLADVGKQIRASVQPEAEGNDQGVAVLLQRERRRARSPDAIRVLDRSGRQIGRVPESSARPLAMQLDRGHRYAARVRYVGEPRRCALAVVAVEVYRPEARVEGALTLAESVAHAGLAAESVLASRLLQGFALAAAALLLVRACS